MRAALVCGLAVLLAPAAVRAQAVAQRALLPVKVNEAARAEVLAILDGEDVFVPSSFAAEIGLPLQKATTREIDGESHVSLRSLAPDVTFAIDATDLLLSITADARLLRPQELALRRGVTIADRGGDPSLFLNYALTGRDLNSASAFAEVGASRAHRFLYSGLSSFRGRVTRGLTSANIDVPSKLRRYTAGDRVIGTDILGATTTIGGVTVSSEFALQPYLIRSPAVDVTGTATTPSTVEVYVNGQLTNRVAVGPGPFTLRDLPATGGLGSTRLVVRDVFGREVVQEGSFYYSTLALRRGLSEYTFSTGALRNDLTRSFDYDELAAYAHYRRGITDNVTVGGRTEVSEKVVSGGPRLTLATRFGDFDVSAAASSGDGASGSAGSVAYRLTAPRYSFGFSGVKRSDQYSTLSLLPQMDRVITDWSGFVAAHVAWFNVGLLANHGETRDGPSFQRISLQGSAPLGRWGNLFASIGQVKQDGETQPEVLVGLTVGLGRLTTADLQLQRVAGESGVRAEVRRVLGTSNGFGYAVQADTVTDSQFTSLQYQTSFGRYEVFTDPANPRNATASIAGGLVYVGGAMLATRPVHNSFALARVGVPNVRVFSSNQPIGRTNRRGELLITNLLPHYANELRIQDQDVPIDYDVAETTLTVVPPTRGGVVAAFRVRPLRSFTGRLQLMIVGEPFTPSLGLVEIETGSSVETLPLGHEGEFYSEQLSPGSYPAQLRIGRITCRFTLSIAPSEQPVTDLGVLSCVP
jgi:outer membrane usher protein